MIKLKNCPNCGGILDDTGRCMYCKSKVYNLTDVNIDMDTRDILLFKIRTNGNDVYFSAKPVHAEIELNTDRCYAYDMLGNKLVSFTQGYNMDIHMDFQAVEKRNDESMMQIMINGDLESVH